MDNSTTRTNMSASVDEINQREMVKRVPVLVILLLLLVVGVVGNSLVLVVYKFKLRRSSARVYVISLAMADLLVCLVGIPYFTLDNVWVVNYTAAHVCRCLSFVMFAGSFSSVFVLLVVGLDRFLKVCRPLKRQIKDFGDRKACCVAMVTAVVISVPVLILYGSSSYESEHGYVEVNCFVDDDYRGEVFSTVYSGITLLIFIGSVVFLIIIYGFICKKIYEHDQMQGEIVIDKNKKCCSCLSSSSDDADEELNEDQDSGQNAGVNIEMKPMTNANDDDACDTKPLASSDSTRVITSEASNSNGKKKIKQVPSSTMIRHTAPGTAQQKNTRKITLMMFTITVVFIIAYLPFVIISILDNMTDFWEDMSDFEVLMTELMLKLYVVNNVANPIIYCFWDKRFRKECIRVLRKIFCCHPDEKDSKNNSSSNGSHTRYTLAQ